MEMKTTMPLKAYCFNRTGRLSAGHTVRWHAISLMAHLMKHLRGASLMTIKLMNMLLITSVSLWASQVLAAPYIPKQDNEVVERLPLSLISVRQKNQSNNSVSGDNSVSDNAQADLNTQLNLAKQYIITAQVEADPRWYGYAQAALSNWWDSETAPLEVRLFKAMILQHNHQFDEALLQLDQVLSQQPRNAQARLVRAQVYLVKNDYQAARHDCQALTWLTSSLITINCLAQVDSLTGNAAFSYAQLQKLIKERVTEPTDGFTPNSAADSATTPEEQFDVYLTLATIAHRLGKSTDAEAYYRRALVISPKNDFALIHYADLLLEQQKYTAVRELINVSTQHLGLQTRLLEALITQQQTAENANTANKNLADSLSDNLQQQFNQAIQRDQATTEKTFPAKDFARFALHILEKPESALSAAVTNWQTQREPEDALLLLETAIAANDVQQIEIVAHWVEQTGIEDIRLQQTLKQLHSHAGAWKRGEINILDRG